MNKSTFEDEFRGQKISRHKVFPDSNILLFVQNLVTMEDASLFLKNCAKNSYMMTRIQRVQWNHILARDGCFLTQALLHHLLSRLRLHLGTFPPVVGTPLICLQDRNNYP